MKKLMPLLAIIVCSCNNSESAKVMTLQKQADSLTAKLASTYKPGLGEFMSSIQVHHAKLWFAGTRQNWDLANFEITEIKEALDDISLYCPERPEVQKLPMITPLIDSISHAVQTKNAVWFKSSFVLLTSACNNCHQATNHGFNVIRIPDQPPFSNQDFNSH